MICSALRVRAESLPCVGITKITRWLRVMVEARITGKARITRMALRTSSPRRVGIIWRTRINSTNLLKPE